MSDPSVKAAFEAYLASYNQNGGEIYNLTGGIKDIVYDKTGNLYSYLDYELSPAAEQ